MNEMPGKTSNNREELTAQVTKNYLLYAIIPTWLIAGFVDYLFHRKTKIETTSGTRESLIHILMMTEMGIPLFISLLFEINAAVLSISFILLLFHQLTAFWDLHYTATRRKIMPLEQMTHSFLEMLPFTSFSFIACLHWDQFLPLLGKSTKSKAFTLQPKKNGVGLKYLLAITAGIIVLGIIPYTEEILRCSFAKGKQGSD